MNDQSTENNPETKDQAEGLQKLREKFPDHLIGKLPKPTKTQTDAVKKDFKKGIRCDICGGWHHPKVVHLDYVGHASATDRMLDADKFWTWEPLAVDDNSLPLFDNIGGLWIKLTICGVTRLGYGCPDGKTGGNAIKETIGDAIRNAGMRFGIALDLWCKEDLHQVDAGEDLPKEPQAPKKTLPDYTVEIDTCKTVEDINDWLFKNQDKVKSDLNEQDIKKFRSYVNQLKDVQKPKTVICPQSEKESLLKDCQTSDCFNTCDIAREALI